MPTKTNPTSPTNTKTREAFCLEQKDSLLTLKDRLLDCMTGLRSESRLSGVEASAGGEHHADASSDACDIELALGALSASHDSLFEINSALKRIELGVYGTCESCGKPIPEIRLSALPFARYTIECQSQLEQSGHRRTRVHAADFLSSKTTSIDEDGDDD